MRSFSLLGHWKLDRNNLTEIPRYSKQAQRLPELQEWIQTTCMFLILLHVLVAVGEIPDLIDSKQHSSYIYPKSACEQIKTRSPCPALPPYYTSIKKKERTLIKTVVLNAMHLCTPFANIITIIEALVEDY